MNTVERFTLDLGAGYIVSYKRMLSWDSRGPTDTQYLAPITLTVPGASTFEHIDAVKFVCTIRSGWTPVTGGGEDVYATRMIELHDSFKSAVSEHIPQDIYIESHEQFVFKAGSSIVALSPGYFVLLQIKLQRPLSE